MTEEKSEETNDSLAIIVSEGTFDKAMMPFIMGSTAVAMGMEVHIFFTFFGLPLLKKKTKPKLPGMFRFFTGMIEKKMKKMKIQGFEEQRKMAVEMGINLYACSTSMGILGIKKEDLIDGVKIVGAATFLDIAANSKTSLFV